MVLQVRVDWLAQPRNTVSETSCTQHWMGMSIWNRQPCRYMLECVFETYSIGRSPR